MVLFRFKCRFSIYCFPAILERILKSNGNPGNVAAIRKIQKEKTAFLR